MRTGNTHTVLGILFILASAISIHLFNGPAKGEGSHHVLHVNPTYEDTLQAQRDSLKIQSEYDMETVDKKHQKEFMENLAHIEKEFGQQWDFCTCVVKNDSIDKAFKKDLSDAEFDRVAARFDVIEKKCKAFLVQSPNQTPDERQAHNKKVRDCLKAAGVN